MVPEVQWRTVISCISSDPLCFPGCLKPFLSPIVYCRPVIEKVLEKLCITAGGCLDPIFTSNSEVLLLVSMKV